MSVNRVNLPGKLSLNIDGKIYLKVDKELLQEYFKEVLMGEPEVDVEVNITRFTEKRTNPQLSYFYGFVLPIIKERFEDLEGTEFTKDEVMTILKSKFFYEEIMFEGEFQKFPLSLSNASKKEIRKFISDVINFGREILEVNIPESI